MLKNRRKKGKKEEKKGKKENNNLRIVNFALQKSSLHLLNHVIPFGVMGMLEPMSPTVQGYPLQSLQSIAGAHRNKHVYT